MNINFKNLAAWLFGIALIGLGVSFFLFNQAGVDFRNLEDFDKAGDASYTGEISDTMEFDIGRYDRISIKSVSSPVDIVKTDGALKAEFKGKVRSSKKEYRPRLVKSVSGSELLLEIEYPKGLIAGPISSDARLTVYLPGSYSEDLSVKSVSGNVHIGSFDLDDISVGCVSGEITADRLTFSEGVFESTSGGIEMEELSGRLLGKTTSGNVKIAFGSLEDTVYLESISGNLELSLPEGAAFTLKTETVSGDLECGIPLVLKAGKGDNILADISGGGSMVEIRTVSGNMLIN